VSRCRNHWARILTAVATAMSISCANSNSCMRNTDCLKGASCVAGECVVIPPSAPPDVHDAAVDPSDAD
jgi:hypothetical protein